MLSGSYPVGDDLGTGPPAQDGSHTLDAYFPPLTG